MIVTIRTSSPTQTVGYWKQERLILDVLLSGVTECKLWTSLHGSSASPIATYNGDTNGRVYIDMTDYVRTYGACVIYGSFRSGIGLPFAITTTVEGLINPDNVIIPTHAHEDWMRIAPPSRMLSSYATDQIVTFGLLADATNPTTLKQYDDEGALVSTSTITGYKNVQLDSEGVAWFAIEHDGVTVWRQLEPNNCEVKYAVLDWVDFRGWSRCHAFELIKATTETQNNYSLLPLDNEYVEVKGRADGFTLFIDGLDAYDLWYYADVLTSSHVEACIDGENWVRVQVTNKSITYPTAPTNNDGKLEINVNYTRYDAVAL